jgi:hypothetical protein
MLPHLRRDSPAPAPSSSILPVASSASTTAVCPLVAAHHSGVSPLLPFASGSTLPVTSSVSTIAYDSGIRPSQSFASGSIFNSVSTTAVCPLPAANHSAVRPSPPSTSGSISFSPPTSPQRVLGLLGLPRRSPSPSSLARWCMAVKRFGVDLAGGRLKTFQRRLGLDLFLGLDLRLDLDSLLLDALLSWPARSGRGRRDVGWLGPPIEPNRD